MIVGAQDRNALELSRAPKTVTCARFEEPTKNDSSEEVGERAVTPARPETTASFTLYGFDKRPEYLGLISDFRRR